MEVPATTFFPSKIKNDLRHGGICCSRRRIKMTSRKRQPRDGANLASSHFFAKKGKIDGFPSLILPKNVKNVNADAPKCHRECETRRDEATLVLTCFLLKKKQKVNPTRGTAIFALFRDPSFLASRMRDVITISDFCGSKKHMFFVKN